MLIDFDKVTHTYRDEAGNVIPSVTQIISSARLIDSTWFTDEARLRGQLVHTATALDDDGILDYDYLDSEIRPYVDAWRKFKDESKCEIMLVEHQVYSDIWKYAGTLDRTGLINNERFVLDIKTGTPQLWVALQTAAYAKCLYDFHHRASVELKSDGTYRLTRYKADNDFAVFCSCLYLYNWRKNNGCANT